MPGPVVTPKRKSVAVSIRMPADLHDEIAAIEAETGRSKAAVCVILMRAGLEKHREPKHKP